MLEIEKRKLAHNRNGSTVLDGCISVVQTEVDFEYKRTGNHFLVYKYYFRNGLQEGEQLYFKNNLKVKLK